MTARPIAYVCSVYPALSHAFVRREIDALRRRGARVQPFSVHRPSASEIVGESDRREAEATPCLLPPAPARLLAAFAWAAFTRPRRLVRCLLLALRLRAAGLRGAVWQVFYWSEAVLLWRACHRRGIRHIHAHFANNAADIALLAAFLGDSPEGPCSWSFTMHGCTEFFDVGHYRLARKIEHATFVVCISDFTRSQMMRLVDASQWSKLHVVRCGVSLSRFTPPQTRDAAGAVRILVVSRLAPGKGLEILTDAMRELFAMGLDASLTVVGEGRERAGLERSIGALGLGDRVDLLGALAEEAIAARYRDADIFCLPSFAEGLPVVVMEAMASGLPVVATRVMAVPEIVADGESGLLVSPGRVDELAAALARLVSSEDERARMGARGRRIVEEGFDLEASANALLALFHRYLEPNVEACTPAVSREADALVAGAGSGR